MFKVYKRDLADVEPVEYLPAAEGKTLAAGVAAVLSGGKLQKAAVPVDDDEDETAAAAAAAKAAAAKAGWVVLGGARADGLYPAMRVLPTTVFETVSAAAVPAALIGTTVALGADSASVTATAGSAFVVEQTENKAGGWVRGRFA